MIPCRHTGPHAVLVSVVGTRYGAVGSQSLGYGGRSKGKVVESQALG